jgi:hypothetical protein
MQDARVNETLTHEGMMTVLSSAWVSLAPPARAGVRSALEVEQRGSRSTPEE